jgi:hypothetical protein
MTGVSPLHLFLFLLFFCWICAGSFVPGCFVIKIYLAECLVPLYLYQFQISLPDLSSCNQSNEAGGVVYLRMKIW